MRPAGLWVVGLLGFILVATACSSSAEEDSAGTVTVFGPYRGEDAARFAESFAAFERDTGIDVRYTGTGSLPNDLIARIDEDNKPDVAIIPQPAVLRSLVDQGWVVELGPAAAGAVAANYSDSAIDLMTFDESLYGVLYRASVKSLVWYPPEEFARLGYTVPETFDQLIGLTDRMAQDGYEPWCLTLGSFGSTGWVGTDWVEDLVLRFGDSDSYAAWVEGQIPFDSPLVRAAVSGFGVFARGPGLVYGGTRRALGVLWSDAADPMFESTPRCLLHRQGSFYRASLPDGVEIGTDVDTFLFPPATENGPTPVVAGGDLAAAFDDRPEVQAFLAYLATPASGEAWAKAGDYAAPHATFDLGNYGDPFSRRVGEILRSAEVLEFDASDRMTPAVGTGTFWEGMVYYVRTGDLDGAVTLMDSGYVEE